MKRYLVVLLLAVAACQPAASDSSAVDLFEFAIDAERTVLNAGTVSFSISNSGEFPHTFVVTERMGSVIAATDLIAPGQGTVLRVDLPQGEYLITCRIVAQTDSGLLIDHFEEGMITELTVGA